MSASVTLEVVDLDRAGGGTAGDWSVLGPDEQARAHRFRSATDRRRWVAAHAWLRRRLAARTGVSPEALGFTIGHRGKPTLPAGPWFNLAHAGGLAALAVAADRPVGVDLEPVPGTVDLDAAALVLSGEELAAVHAGGPHAFAVAWTRKEAWVKALGTGLDDTTRTVSLLGDPAGAPDGITVRTVVDRTTHPGHAVVVSVAAPGCDWTLVRSDDGRTAHPAGRP